MAIDILVVDDEQDIRDLVSGVLQDEGYHTRTAANSDEVFDALMARRPALVLLDVWLRGSKLDGLEILKEIKVRDTTLPVIIFSGHGNIDTAVAAIAEGAVDFLEKPFEAEKLLHLVRRATETSRLRDENAELRAMIGHSDDLIGTSSVLNAVRATLKRVANTGSRLLISGPAGVGKEVAARLLHNWSNRADAPFICVSAACMEPERLEEELFGEERDGIVHSPGVLERAHGGTLFLDEVADMPLATQGKILRVLTEQSFNRIGGSRQVQVDIRIVSSTSRNLEHEIEQKRFREDLYYRLNVVPVYLPPLAQRREDVLPLVEHFAARFAAERKIIPPVFSAEAIAALQSAEWPGNIRQLRNVVERTIILAPTDQVAHIDINMLPNEVVESHTGDTSNVVALMGAPLREARESFEREYLRIQLRRFSGNISRTASFIGMERSALHRKLKLLGLTDRRLETEEPD